MITVSHNPFARHELQREKVSRKCECSWCGQPARFIYYILKDGIYTRSERIDGEFCSIGCMRYYHNSDC